LEKSKKVKSNLWFSVSNLDLNFPSLFSIITDQRNPIFVNILRKERSWCFFLFFVLKNNKKKKKSQKTKDGEKKERKKEKEGEER